MESVGGFEPLMRVAGRINEWMKEMRGKVSFHILSDCMEVR